MRNSSLWLRLVTAQLVIALVLAALLPFVVDRTIHAIGYEVTQDFLRSVTARSGGAPAAARAPSRDGDPRYGAVATFVVGPGMLTQLAGPRIEDIGARPAPHGNRPIFSHGPYSDFYLSPANQPQRWILAAEDRRHPAVITDDVIRFFLHRFAIIVPLSLVISVAATLVIVRLAMRPIRRATAEVAAIDVMSPSQRLSEQAMPKDIWPLVHATNETLERLERALDRERRFNATISHELRTALSTILLRGEALPDGRERRAIEQAVARASGVIDQMLELGAIESGLGRLRELSLAGPVREVTAQMQPILSSSGRKLRMRFEGPENAPIVGLESLVVIALRNLIDNANRHSTAGGDIDVVCNCVAGVVTVADCGPGLSVREEAGGRRVFARADGVRSQSSGLGLAIVHRVMENCGGSLSFGHSASGGTIAMLMFRPAT